MAAPAAAAAPAPDLVQPADVVDDGPHATTAALPNDRRHWIARATAAGWGLIGVIFAIEASTIIRAYRLWLAHRMPDDALYYLETARRLARGQGPTFDGIHRTNGFHPLWQAMATGLALVFPRGGDTLIKAALLTNLALSLVAVVLVYRLLRRVVGPLGAVVAVLVSVHSTATLASWVNGMESAALLAALGLLLTALDRFDHRRDVRSAALAGGATALVVLARVDVLTVIWLVPVWMLWRCRSEHWSRRFRLLVAWGTVAGLPVGAWAVFNLVEVGHILPVSGSLKLWSMSQYAQRYGGRLTFGYAGFALSFVHHYVATMAASVDAQGVSFFPLTLLALIGVVVFAGRRLFRSGDGGEAASHADNVTRGVLLLGLAIVVAKAAADLALLPIWVEGWYSAPARLATGVLIGLGAYECIAVGLRHFRLVGAVLAVVAVVAVLPFDGLRFLRSPSEPAYPWSWQDANLEAVAWISAHGPLGVYGSRDAGVLGYYLDPARPVVNLDGLINDYRYASMLEHNVAPVPRYQAEGVRYLLGRLGPPGSLDVPTCAVQLWRSSHDVLYGGSRDAPQVTAIPIRVYDLGGCPRV